MHEYISFMKNGGDIRRVPKESRVAVMLLTGGIIYQKIKHDYLVAVLASNSLDVCKWSTSGYPLKYKYYGSEVFMPCYVRHNEKDFGSTMPHNGRKCTFVLTNGDIEHDYFWQSNHNAIYKKVKNNIIEEIRNEILT